MATYDHKQVLADYAAGRITPEMAVGHSLQHSAQLYETQELCYNRIKSQPNTSRMGGCGKGTLGRSCR